MQLYASAECTTAILSVRLFVTFVICVKTAIWIELVLEK